VTERQINLEEAIVAASPFGGLKHGHYAVIVADPPWHFKTRTNTRQTRAPSNHYSTMSIGDIKALPVSDLAARNSVLLLWVLNSMLPQGLDVMESWGFAFKTMAFTWAKTTSKTDCSWAPKFHMGLGYWSRQNSESCLLGVRGKPKRIHRDVRQLIIAPRREHSRKPDEFFAGVERLLPGPYLEMFARQIRPGWESWGNQTDKFAGSPAITEGARL
jgi:N6-adenosine-specific RNA methylase IME4